MLTYLHVGIVRIVRVPLGEPCRVIRMIEKVSRESSRSGMKDSAGSSRALP